MKKPELLAPAGDFSSLKAAINAGADAVYLGGKNFNARISAENFDREEIMDAVDYAHLRGVKIYVTLNILVKNDELNEIFDYISFLYELGTDALIVQSAGLAKKIKEIYPDFPVHASTQMTIHNFYGVKEAEELNFSRIVLSRELPLEEIKKIKEKINKENSSTETEVFVHGALCLSYSGQCLMSSFISSRSGNRGKCAQPCRLEYKITENGILKENEHNYILSTRDLCTIENIGEMIEAGIDSFKIEGRMKKPEYVYNVVKIYRKAIDSFFEKGSYDSDINTLKQVFNREFTEGYIFGAYGNEIVSPVKPDNRGLKIGKIINVSGNKIFIESDFKLTNGDGIEFVKDGKSFGGMSVSGFSENDNIYELTLYKSFELPENTEIYRTYDKSLNDKTENDINREIKKPIYINFKVKSGEKAEIKVYSGKHSFVMTSEKTAEKALKTATSEERIRQQLSKTGDTPFYAEEITTECDEGISFPISEINRMRRESIENLTEIITESYRRRIKSHYVTPVYSHRSEHLPEIRVSVWYYDSLSAFEGENIDEIYFYDTDNLSRAYEFGIKNNIKIIPALGNIAGDNEIESFEKKLENFDKIVVGNTGLYNFYKNKKDIITDYTFNIFDDESLRCYNNASVINLSPELTLGEAEKISEFSDIKTEIMVYGYIPVMTSEYCVITSVLGTGEKKCGMCKKNVYTLKDRRDFEFPVITDSGCRMHILNSKPLIASEYISEIKYTDYIRLFFTIESPEEIKEIYKTFVNINNGNEDREVINIIDKYKMRGFTKGHMENGV
ncbi:MAG TPA: U32 family peptidase [Tepiditoga sp.]|nr:U32 family peptidase [Tepiditoga sp.]